MTKEITNQEAPKETDLMKAARLFVEGYSEVLDPNPMGFTAFDYNYNDARVALHNSAARKAREARRDLVKTDSTLSPKADIQKIE